MLFDFLEIYIYINIFRPRRLNSVLQLQSQIHEVTIIYTYFLSFQTFFFVQNVVLFHHTRFDIGVRVEWKLGGSHQLTGRCPVRVELELHVVRQQHSSHLGKQAVWRVFTAKHWLFHASRSTTAAGTNLPRIYFLLIPVVISAI